MRILRNSRGVTIIEFAVVLPLLFALVLSIVDFGMYFFIQHTIQFATREGVRFALVGRTLNDSNGNPLSREASIIQTIDQYAAIAVRPQELQISIFPVKDDFTDPDDWKDTQDAGQSGSYMRVKTRYDYTFVTPLIRALVPDGKLAIRAQATYRNELF
jgi:TadE-like protein